MTSRSRDLRRNGLLCSLYLSNWLSAASLALSASAVNYSWRSSWWIWTQVFVVLASAVFVLLTLCALRMCFKKRPSITLLVLTEIVGAASIATTGVSIAFVIWELAAKVSSTPIWIAVLIIQGVQFVCSLMIAVVLARLYITRRDDNRQPIMPIDQSSPVISNPFLQQQPASAPETTTAQESRKNSARELPATGPS